MSLILSNKSRRFSVDGVAVARSYRTVRLRRPFAPGEGYAHVPPDPEPDPLVDRAEVERRRAKLLASGAVVAGL